ncbi:MAG: hypothetical protein ABIS45_01190 [Burkholderiales bacterium]
MPTSTVVSAAFLTHGRLAAKNLQLDDLPLVVTPHPLNDLTPDEVRDLARAAYPVVIRQLTGQGAQEKQTKVDYVHPAMRRGGSGKERLP